MTEHYCILGANFVIWKKKSFSPVFLLFKENYKTIFINRVYEREYIKFIAKTDLIHNFIQLFSECYKNSLVVRVD